jgi:hypothetical protein
MKIARSRNAGLTEKVFPNVVGLLWNPAPNPGKNVRPNPDCYETKVIERFRAMFRVREHRFFVLGRRVHVVVA